jgi:hypothetical protein
MSTQNTMNKEGIDDKTVTLVKVSFFSIINICINIKNYVLSNCHSGEILQKNFLNRNVIWHVYIYVTLKHNYLSINNATDGNMVKRQEAGEDCTMRSFIICMLLLVLLGWSNQGGREGWGTWHAWEGWEIITHFWLENLEVRNRLEELNVDRRITIEWIHEK